MPKPDQGDNGSGMHTTSHCGRTSGRSSPATNTSDLSEKFALVTYHRPPGGIIKHAKAINASATDDQQLQAADPGFEGRRSCWLLGPQPLGLVRIPIVSSRRQSASRSAIRTGGPTRTSPLRDDDAGLDGIQNKLHPGDRWTRTLRLAAEELKDIPTVCGSLPRH